MNELNDDIPNTTLNNEVEDTTEESYCHENDDHTEAAESVEEEFCSAEGPFSIEENTLFHEGPDGCEPIMLGLAYARAAIKMPDNTAAYAIGYRNVAYDIGEIIVTGDELGGDIAKRLNKQGLFVKKPALVREFLVQTAAACARVGTKQLVDQVGWHKEHSIFCSGQKLYHDDTRTDIDAFQMKVRPDAKMRQQGTLESWQSMIGVHIVRNDLPLFATCFALSSVLLDRVALGSMLVNFCGQKGQGKTLTLQLAASAYGDASDPALGAHTDAYVTKFASTQNAFDALLGQYGCLPAILDEFGETDIKEIGRLCYALASGQAKHRMDSNGELRPQKRWLLHLLLSGEVSIAHHIAENGGVQKGGQADRAADLPLPETGVFPDLGPFDSFPALAAHLKRACTQQFGTLGEAFVKHCVANPDSVSESLALLPDFEAFLSPEGIEAGELRVIKHFALSAIAGSLAAEAGLLPCDSDRVNEAHKAVANLWWGYRADSIGQIKVYLRERAGDIKFGKLSIHDAALAAIIDEGYIHIPRDVFKAAFDDHEKIARELDEFGMLYRKEKKQNRYPSRWCNNKIWTFALHAEKFADVVAELRAAAEV